MILPTPKKMLVLAPHTDDGEFGCGATIAQMVERGAEVFYVAFSAAEESVPKGMPSDILRHEARAATKCLGLHENNLKLLNYRVRQFPKFRQEILEDLVILNKEIQPDLVFLPCSDDTHQDHEVIAREGFRAFKQTSILGYELPWNNRTSKLDCFVSISEENLNLKNQAIACYESQKHRVYANDSFVRSLATMRGALVNCNFAEAFEVLRIVFN